MAYHFELDSSGDSPSNHELAHILKIARREALSRGANAHEADEVAQKVMIKMWRTWRCLHVVRARLRGTQRWEGYIRISARNVHIDLIRQHQRRMSREDRYLDHPSISLGSRPNVMRPVPPNTSEAESYLGREHLVGLIEHLPEKQREVALAIFVNELSIAEVAEQLGLQQQSVRKRLRKAQQIIKAELREVLTDDHEQQDDTPH